MEGSFGLGGWDQLFLTSLGLHYPFVALRLCAAGFYDRSSKLWEEVWGEHMHHGYYDPPDRTDHTQAQVDMIDKLLSFSGVVGEGVEKVRSR